MEPTEDWWWWHPLSSEIWAARLAMVRSDKTLDKPWPVTEWEYQSDLTNLTSHDTDWADTGISLTGQLRGSHRTSAWLGQPINKYRCHGCQLCQLNTDDNICEHKKDNANFFHVQCLLDVYCVCLLNAFIVSSVCKTCIIVSIVNQTHVSCHSLVSV